MATLNTFFTLGLDRIVFLDGPPNDLHRLCANRNRLCTNRRWFRDAVPDGKDA